MSEDEYIEKVFDKLKELGQRIEEQNSSLAWHRDLLAKHLAHFDMLNERIKDLENKLKECCGTRSWQG